MPRSGYDISGAGYYKRINELTSKYQVLAMKARDIRDANGGKPSVEEAKLLREAGKLCEEAISVAMSERNVRQQWEARLRDCKDRVKVILDVIEPVTPAEPKADGKQTQPSQGASARAMPEGKYVTTASGFKTRNTIPNLLSAETIEHWHQKQNPKLGLDKVIGQQEFKERLNREVANTGWRKTDEAMGISPVHTYFLYGPPGTGKTFMIDCFANEMMKQGFDYIKLVGSEIHSSYVGEAEKIVTAAFHEAIDSAPCILFIDEVEGVCATRTGPDVKDHVKRLTNSFLEARNEMYKSKAQVVFFGGTNLPWGVDAAMLDAAKLVRVPLPDPESRRGFFELQLSQYMLEDGFTIDEMVDATDNYSFRELEYKLVNGMKNELKDKLIEENWVYDENGKRNQEKTDEKVSEIINSGKAVLTRAIFDNERKGLPSDKTEIRERLLAFERGIDA